MGAVLGELHHGCQIEKNGHPCHAGWRHGNRQAPARHGAEGHAHLGLDSPEIRRTPAETLLCGIRRVLCIRLRPSGHFCHESDGDYFRDVGHARGGTATGNFYCLDHGLLVNLLHQRTRESDQRN